MIWSFFFDARNRAKLLIALHALFCGIVIVFNAIRKNVKLTYDLLVVIIEMSK